MGSHGAGSRERRVTEKFKMRPHFSLKWLLIAVTVLSVILFVLVIYPTNKARHFVAGINNGSDVYMLMVPDGTGRQVVAIGGSKVPGAKPLYAELLPWSWDDLLRMRRRVHVVERTTGRQWGFARMDFICKKTAEFSVTPTGHRLLGTTELLLPTLSEFGLKSVFTLEIERPKEIAIDVTQGR
jgi:hypothetical protein